MENPFQFDIRLLSSLEKVFADRHLEAAEFSRASALLGEIYSFQAAVRFTGPMLPNLHVKLESDLPARIDEVALIPSELPVNARSDDYLISRAPGLYPDLLKPLEEGAPYNLIGGQWRAFWVEIDLTGDDVEAGEHPIRVSFSQEKEGVLGEAVFTLDVVEARLPKQKLINTNWFHGDCIADYYQVPVFSERHWDLMEDFVKVAARYGQNMILTPLFTPPLDTKVGGERTTIQLVDVAVMPDGTYRFGFGLLLRFVEMARRAGIEYFEMSHVFTQWGAKHACKVMAKDQMTGEIRRIFGWETDAAGAEYRAFLEQFIPELKDFLAKNRMQDCAYFHVSDEPNVDQMEAYRRVGDHFRELVKPYPVMDALSDIEFYLSGAVEHPIPASDHIAPFLEAKVPGLWTYYCVSQCRKVSNRFFGQPSERNRIIGAQLFKYDIAGFLQWGYNFYNTQYSILHINPFEVTDAGRAFPSGDAFLVYPGGEGALRSIRQLVFSEALQDLRAFELAAEIYGKEEIVRVIEEGVEPITFDEYPHDKKWLLSVREKINRMIADKV